MPPSLEQSTLHVALIGVWGRGAQRNYATFQMTLYLGLGALIALVGSLVMPGSRPTP